MNKIIFALLMLFTLNACSSEQSFKGKEYQMLQAPSNATIKIGFSEDENRYFGKVVNNYFGMYEVEGNEIKFGPAGSTMMMGPQEMMNAEMEYFKILPSIKNFHFADSNLVLVTDNGQELVFEEVIKKAK